MRIPTPKVPIAIRPNLVLKFEIQSFGEDVDPRSGNPILQTIPYEVEAMVAMPPSRSASPDTPGLNLSATYCEGFIVGDIPEGLEFKAQNRIPAVLHDNTGGQQSGDFVIGNYGSAYAVELKQVAGVPIRGFFYVAGGG